MKKDYRKEFNAAVIDVEEYTLLDLGFEAICDVINHSKDKELIKEAIEYRDNMMEDHAHLRNMYYLI